MLTLKGSILGAVVFVSFLILYMFAPTIWYRSKLPRVPRPSGGQVGWDVVTMYHNSTLPGWRDPFFWIALIVFMWMFSRLLGLVTFVFKR